MTTSHTLRFDGRVAIVTGAGRGIGREHALLLAARGASVLVNDLGGAFDGTGSSSEPAQQIAAEIRERGGTAIADTHSVATRDGAQAMVDAALSQFGRIDIIISNAGGARGPWTEMIELNLSATHWICAVAWPHLEKQRYGRILTTASSAGLFGMRPPRRADGLDFFAYAAAKAGVVGLTRSLALEGARANIMVNGIAPVAFSRMTAAAPNADAVRWLQDYFPPHHIATAAACLVHESCPLSGEIFSVGGGRVARIVIGETLGFSDPALTPEQLMSNFDKVLDRTRIETPRTVDDEMNLYAQLLGANREPLQS